MKEVEDEEPEEEKQEPVLPRNSDQPCDRQRDEQGEVSVHDFFDRKRFCVLVPLHHDPNISPVRLHFLDDFGRTFGDSYERAHGESQSTGVDRNNQVPPECQGSQVGK